MANADRSSTAVDSRLAEMLKIAADLRDLPRGDFKARLKADLLAAAQRAAVPAHYGRVLMTVEDYIQRIGEMSEQAPLQRFDLNTALSDLPDRGTRFLTGLNECAIGVSRFSGMANWECHFGSDELLHILDGEADVTTMTTDGPVHSSLQAGSLFICPKGLWHRVQARSDSLTMFFATPTDTEGAMEPAGPGQRGDGRVADSASAPHLDAHDLGTVLRDLPSIHITPETTATEADAAVRMVTSIGACAVGLMRFSGESPWERHPDGDELLHVIEGAVDVTVLTDDGPTEIALDAGSVFVCPKGLWHRQRPRPSVTLLFGTPTEHGEATFADDPRHA